MFEGHLGKRFKRDDRFQIDEPRREQTLVELGLMAALGDEARRLRHFIENLPVDADMQSVSQSLFRLDECVMWAKRAIDG